MDGFFLIDKPSGQTSFDVLRDMRRILGIKKIGHTGTLDPLATGCLLVATGAYTRLIPLVEKDQKTYLATLRLNGTSPSYDSDTAVEYLSIDLQEKYLAELTQQKIQDCISQHFSGNITQVPPKYSALKINGKRALDRTLAGEEIEMKARQAHIFYCDVVSFSYPELVLDCRVSAGTYIRSIAHDLGERLSTGGYLTALRRSSIGSLHIDMAQKIDELSPEAVLDPKEIFGDKIHLLDDAKIYERLGHGQRVRAELELIENTEIILSDGQKLRYIVEYKNGVIHPRKKIA